MLRLLTILLFSVATANAAIPIIFLRAGTNAVVVSDLCTNDPAAYWNLDDFASPALDNTDGDRDATAGASGASGSTTFGVAGIIGTAVLHDLTDTVSQSRRLVVPDDGLVRLTNTSFTLRGWMNIAFTNTAAGSFHVFSKIPHNASSWTNSGYRFEAAWFTNAWKLSMSIYNGTAQQSSIGSTALDSNTWYHCVTTYNADTQTLKVYLNGSLENTATAVGPVVGGTNDLFVTEVRANHIATLDECGIWLCEWNAQNVSNDYNSAVGVQWAYPGFTDTTGYTFEDPETGETFRDPES